MASVFPAYITDHAIDGLGLPTVIQNIFSWSPNLTVGGSVFELSVIRAPSSWRKES